MVSVVEVADGHRQPTVVGGLEAVVPRRHERKNLVGRFLLGVLVERSVVEQLLQGADATLEAFEVDIFEIGLGRWRLPGIQLGLFGPDRVEEVLLVGQIAHLVGQSIEIADQCRRMHCEVGELGLRELLRPPADQPCPVGSVEVAAEDLVEFLLQRGGGCRAEVGREVHAVLSGPLLPPRGRIRQTGLIERSPGISCGQLVGSQQCHRVAHAVGRLHPLGDLSRSQLIGVRHRQSRRQIDGAGRPLCLRAQALADLCRLLGEAGYLGICTSVYQTDVSGIGTRDRLRRICASCFCRAEARAWR